MRRSCKRREAYKRQYNELLLFIREPGHRKMCLMSYANNKGADQPDQRLCCSLFRYYNISIFYSRNFKTLASFRGCAGRFVSGLVGNSRRHVLSCRGSHVYHLFQMTNQYILFLALVLTQFGVSYSHLCSVCTLAYQVCRLA